MKIDRYSRGKREQERREERGRGDAWLAYIALRAYTRTISYIHKRRRV